MTLITVNFDHKDESYRVIVEVDKCTEGSLFNPASFEPRDEGELEYEVTYFLIEVDEDVKFVSNVNTPSNTFIQDGYMELRLITPEKMIGESQFEQLVRENYWQYIEDNWK